MATQAQEEAAQTYAQEIGGAVIDLVRQGEVVGLHPALVVAGIIGGLAAVTAARGMKREGVVAGLNSAWDDIEAGG